MMMRLIIHNADKLALSMKGRKEKVHDAMKRRIDFLLEQLYALIIDKVKGRVLQVRSGRLLDSIRIENAGDYRVTAYQTSIGKYGSLSGFVTQDRRIAPYGEVQEYGGKKMTYKIVPQGHPFLFFTYPGKKVEFMSKGKLKSFRRASTMIFAKEVNRKRLQ